MASSSSSTVNSPVRPEIFSIELDTPSLPASPASPPSPSSSASSTRPHLRHSYLPDSVISGKIYLKLRQPLRVKALRINLYGIEYVRFAQTAPLTDSATKKKRGPSSNRKKRQVEGGRRTGAEEQEPLTSPKSNSNKTASPSSPNQHNHGHNHGHHHHQHHHHNHQHHHHNQTFSESHVIFDSEVRFAGIKEGQVVQVLEDYPEIESGAGVYSFSFQLPHANLPASFEGEYGCIRYFLKASLELPFGASLPFTSFKPLTISSAHPTFLPSFQQPVKREEEHSLCVTSCCWGCREGTVFCQVQSQAQAYVPGQDIRILARLLNSLGKDVLGFTLRLNRDIRFMAEGHVRSELQERISDTVVETRVRSSREIHQFELSLPIPKTACPSTCHTTQLITVEYYVHVLVHIEGVEHPLKYVFPLLVGSVKDSQAEDWIRSLRPAKTNSASANETSLGSIYDRRVTAPIISSRTGHDKGAEFPQTLPLYDASQEVSNMTASLFRHQYN